MVYQTFERVFHQIFKRFRISFEKNSAATRFSTHFSVFGYLMKHSLLCLIYYMNNWSLIDKARPQLVNRMITLSIGLKSLSTGYPLGFGSTYPMDSDLSVGWH